jgi:hypothetical protein
LFSSFVHRVVDGDAGEDCGGGDGGGERRHEQHRRQEAREHEESEQATSGEAPEHRVLQDGSAGEEQCGPAEDGDGRRRSWVAEWVIED